MPSEVKEQMTLLHDQLNPSISVHEILLYRASFHGFILRMQISSLLKTILSSFIMGVSRTMLRRTQGCYSAESGMLQSRLARENGLKTPTEVPGVGCQLN